MDDLSKPDKSNLDKPEADTSLVDASAVDMSLTTLLEQQPSERIERDGVQYTVLGTAHVSKASADAVEALIDSGEFDAVAIELDKNRFASLMDPERWAKLDLFQVIRSGRAGMVGAQLALSAFQQRVAEQFDIEAGQEMRVAIKSAQAANLPLLLIDRDIGITMRRVYRNVPWWQRLTLFSGLIASVFSNEEISEEDIEKLKQGDMLESTFQEFAETSERLYTPLIAERDMYMAARLREEGQARTPAKNILVVIGAGHLKGLSQHLRDGDEDAVMVREQLEQIPEPSVWPKLLPWFIVGIVVLGFFIGFARSPELGFSLVRTWILSNGLLAGLGAIVALAHPLTVLAAFVAAPITSLNPLIGAGVVAAGVELWFRKPQVGDFEDLRKDIVTARGWWHNRVAKTILVFFLTSLGSALGTYLGGARIFGRLFG